MDGVHRIGVNQWPASFKETVKHIDSGARLLQFETPPCHFLAV